MPHVSTRTWPYGTIKVGEIRWLYKNASQSVAIIACPSDPGEAFVLMFGLRRFDKFKEGQKVEIEFKAGGPTGAHWDIKDEAK